MFVFWVFCVQFAILILSSVNLFSAGQTMRTPGIMFCQGVVLYYICVNADLWNVFLIKVFSCIYV